MLLDTTKTLDATKTLDERELCDLECLAINAFDPLTTYMTQEQYNECLENLTINNKKDVFPIPIVCMVDSQVSVNTLITLRNKTGIIHAELTVQECWEPDLEYESKCVFGTYDLNHPYIQYLVSKKNSKMYYVSGTLNFKNKVFHNNYAEYRKTPAQVRSENNQDLVGFQTRNPLHRSHIELIKNSSYNKKVLLNPVEGVTQDCDIPFPVRMKCYQSVLSYLGDASLVILPLSMRMAGPREAVWHAVIRRNYGCTHFIVGRDHAGPSYKTQEGKSFYGPLEAQILAKSLEEQIGIKIVTSNEVVYCEEIKSYLTSDMANGFTVKNISGTKLRSMLTNNEEIPSWYSYPEVVKHLKDFYNKPQGACFYFVGLSGAGKSTLAESLKGAIEEEYPSKEVTLLDADIIRTHLSKGLGFSKEDRSMNVRRIGYVAHEIVKHGGIVIVANIAPFEEDRTFNRNLISPYGKYVELYVDTPVEVCEERDVKGLYKAARAGTLKNFTGVSDPFEIPTNAIVVKNRPLDEITKKLNPYCISIINSDVELIKEL
jgi:sulfate adenylyltransferase